MSFSAPLWLLGLLPWFAVVLWLFTGQRDRTVVPFLNLWRGPDAAPPRARRAVHLPPLAILLMMLATLLALLGAARPQLLSTDPPKRISTTAPAPLRNVRIVIASASRSPRAQVMVRLRNDSDLTTALLRVGSSQQQVDLPSRNGERNYFIDLPQLEWTTPIELNVDDDLPADNRVELVQQRSWPLISSRGELPPAVARIIDTYTRLRPAGEGSAGLLVTTAPISADQPAVIVVQGDATAGISEMHIMPHPINANINWPTAIGQELRVAPNPGSGWQVLVQSGERPLVAVRQAPARQVWLGFDSDNWPRTSDFVLFWTNVFDWVGEGGESFKLTAMAGQTSVPATQPAPPPTRAGRDLTPPTLLSALLVIFCATAVWGTCKNCATR